MPRVISELSEAADESRSSLEKANFKLRLRIRQLEQSNRQITRALVEVGDTNDQLRRMIEGAPIGFCTLDASGRITELNCEAAELLGLAQRRCLGQKLAELMIEPDRYKFDKGLFAKIGIDSELKRGIEVTMKALGTVARVRVAPLGGVSAMATPGYVASLEDLEEVRRSQLKEARFHHIAANAEDVYYETDEQGGVLYVSSAYERIWGAQPTSAVGQPWFHAAQPDDRGSAEEARQRLLKGEPFDEEYRIVRADGSIRWIRDRAFLLDPTRTTIAGIARDITEGRELEEELRQAQKLQALGILASRVTHDFGNLLQGVMGCLNIALNSTTSPERSRDYTRQALAAVRGGSSLVQQLMKFGRKDELRPQPVSVDLVIAECAKLLEMLLGEGITLDIQTGAPGTMIVADPVQIEQILMNLAANARDAMTNGGRLAIRTKEVRDANELGQRRSLLRLEARDVGCGMDAETQARIFEPFFTTKSAGKGTGLGLSTVRAVTRALGGWITFESEVGQGTRFVFHFPVAHGGSEGLGSRTPPSSGTRFSGRALLVDDDSGVRMTVRRALEELGFEVAEAANGSEALSRVPENLILLVADIALPDVYGPKLREQLRRRHADLRTLYISAHPAAYLIQRGLVNEGDVILQKPFAVDDLAMGLAKLRLDDGIAVESRPLRERPARLSE